MTGSSEFDDINEAVGAEWEDETTPYGRIRETMSHAYTPVNANDVADTARTSPKTARKHLNALADEGFIMTDTGKNGATTYQRSPESLVVEQAADILENVSTDELVVRVSEMRDRISDFQTEHGVESPDAAANYDGLGSETIREWQKTRRNLAFANAALAIANAERFVVEGRITSTE